MYISLMQKRSLGVLMSENTSKKYRVLLVEDEPHLAFNLEFNLQSEGYEVTPAANGRIAVEKFSNFGPFDCIILDVMMPELNGLEVARIIRKTDPKTGILMLTARAAEEDIVAGLEAGADDYLTKPFHLKELLLRVKRMVQRSDLFPRTATSADIPRILTAGPISLDRESMEVVGPTGTYALTSLEANLLGEFLTNSDRILSRELLLRRVWGVAGQLETRTVDNFIMRLRRLIEPNPTQPIFLESVRGRGYRFNSTAKE